MPEESCFPLSDITLPAHSDGFQCVCDTATRKILQCNGMLKTGRGLKSPVGQFCWKIFQDGATGPCPFCPAHGLVDHPAIPSISERTDEATGRHYRRKDSLIPLEDDRTLHLMHILDITDVHNYRLQLEQDMVLIDLLTNLSLTFATPGHFDEKASRALSTMGRFLGVDRVYLLKDYPEEHYYTRSNIWLNPDVPENDDLDTRKFSFYLHYGENNGDYVALSAHVPVCFSDLAGLPSSMRARWEHYDIVSLLAVPLHTRGQYWGALAFDMCSRPRPWSDSDLRLGQAAGGIISSAIERDWIVSDLHTSQTTLRKVLDTAPLMVYWMDTNYVICGCNQRYADSVLLAPDAVIGKTDYELYAPEFAQEMRQEDVGVLTTITPYTAGEKAFQDRDGQTRWFGVQKLPILDNAGKASLMLCIMHDITDSRKNEMELLNHKAELQEAMKAVEASDRTKTEFLSRMSHEIWTPMNAIIGMTHIASEMVAAMDGQVRPASGGEPSALASEASSWNLERIRACLQKIDTSSKHLTDIMKDILVMSRLSSDRVDLRPSVFDLEPLLIRASGLITETSAEKNQSFCVILEDDVPSSFLGDESHIEQILNSLLSNAVKFTPAGGVLTLRVSLCAPRTKKTADVLFSIEDTGIGIAAEEQKDIFTTFEQSDGGLSRKYGGTGLGLPIGKHLVSLMGGDMGVESELGQGSRFYFNLPLEVVESVTPRDAMMALLASLRLHTLNLLIVDNGPETCQSFLCIAERLGIRAEAAPDCPSALRSIQAALLASKPFDIVFVDVSMPRVDGVETMNRIHTLFGNQSVILTGSAGDRMALERPGAEAVPFLLKPFFASTLLNCLRQALTGPPMPKPAPAIHHEAEFNGKTILMAEDVDINREMLSGMLEPTGAAIVTAENGQDALDLFSSKPDGYDLILMDVHMPKMNGLEATRRIRALDAPRASAVPIIAVTANVFPEDVQECLDAGMTDHIAKPVDEFSLLDTLARYLSDTFVPNPAKDSTPQSGAPPGAPPSAERKPAAAYLPYINITEGLRISHGNQKLYAAMLRNFKEGTLYQDFQLALEGGDKKTAHTHIRTLTRVSAGLSLETMAQCAEQAEDALTHSLCPPAILGALDDAYRETLTLIDAYIKEDEA